MFAGGGPRGGGSCQLSRAIESEFDFLAGRQWTDGDSGHGRCLVVGQLRDCDAGDDGRGRQRAARGRDGERGDCDHRSGPDGDAISGSAFDTTCGLYLAQWPQWSDFRNIDIRGLNTGVAIPALPVTAPAGLNADSNRWQNVTIQATHAFTAAAGSNNVLDNVVALAGNSAATGEPPTGLVLDLSGNAQGWTVRNAVVMPTWNAVQPALAVTAAGGAVTAVTVGSEHGLGWDPYGASVPVAFSGSCTAQATAAVNSERIDCQR